MRLYSYEPIIIESKKNELVNDVQLNNQQPQQELNVQQPQQVQQNLQLQQPANQNQQQGGIGATIIDPTTGQPISVNVSFNVPVTDPQNINQPQQEFSQNQVQKPIQTQVQNIEKQPQFQQQPQQISPTYYQPMSPEDFASAKASISSKSFEDSKLTLAKQIAASNHLTSKQVKEIMQLFSFEDSKLDFAKYAYKYVYDPNNYYIVNDAFKFSSSIDELNEFIKK